MELVERMLEAHGGLDAWLGKSAFAAHVMIGGALLPHEQSTGWLADIMVRHDPAERRSPAHPTKRNLVVEGRIGDPRLYITDGNAPGCYGVYTPSRIEVRDATDRLLEAWDGTTMPLGSNSRDPGDQRFQNLFIIGSTLFNAIVGPFIVAMPGVRVMVEDEMAGLAPVRVVVPPTIDSMIPERRFRLSPDARLASAIFELPGYGLSDGVEETYSAYWGFSGIFLPSLRRLRARGPGGRLAMPPLIDVEIFDLSFR